VPKPGDFGPVYEVRSGSVLYAGIADRGAFRIEGTPGQGTPAPEPASMMGALVGVTIVGFARRRRSRD
jgi:hypothetical protein